MKRLSKDKAQKRQYRRLTNAATKCSDMGFYDIFTQSKEQLIGLTDLETEPTWEYKTAGDSTQVYGPFTSSQMAAWYYDGYFSHTEVFMRREKQGAFVSSDTFDWSKVASTAYSVASATLGDPNPSLADPVDPNGAENDGGASAAAAVTASTV
eukprot:TRINITY_DN612_c0_g1_i10.p2 TRINITY_DN612_c0_g1~~TRINITY_DN612_c0_g1_i10.p2  ORF type:complete len:153 (+),score=43.45 TRINITY_DN612_c0_g1_i10:381-839(+)